jgi:hypothetical protein
MSKSNILTARAFAEYLQAKRAANEKRAVAESAKRHAPGLITERTRITVQPDFVDSRFMPLPDFVGHFETLGIGRYEVQP